jgi:putative endonuclease
MFFVYILRSSINLKYYVGSTEEVTNRIEEHNTGECKSTRKGIPWRLVRAEEYLTRAEAVKKREENKITWNSAITRRHSKIWLARGACGAKVGSSPEGIPSEKSPRPDK